MIPYNQLSLADIFQDCKNKQLYINGHFCYVFKFGIVINGLGIIRHISSYNKDFMASHPDIVVEKKSSSPDEDKCVHDSKLLIREKDIYHIKENLCLAGHRTQNENRSLKPLIA